MTTAAAIMAGGKATRMGGRPKSFLQVGGRRIIDRQLDVLAPRFSELVVIANDPAPYQPLGLPVFADVVRDVGPLGGILTAIESVRAERVLVVACDMPYLSAAALALVDSGDEDVVIPVAGGRPEPLLARYGRACTPAIRAHLAAGERKVTCFFRDVRVREIGEAELKHLDPALRFLANCNTPADLV